MPTEREKMLAGELYDPSDCELTELRLRARRLARRYNTTDEGDPAALQAILSELLPHAGKNLALQAPIYFDYGSHVYFGDRCSANFHFTVLDCARIEIGNNVLFGPNCTLAAPMHPFLPEERNIRQRKDGSLYNLEYARPIVIQSDCWLASNVTVCGGVTIGRGCVIGAGSVVTRDIPPYSLAAGNPCRVIRPLTENDRMCPSGPGHTAPPCGQAGFANGETG